MNHSGFLLSLKCGENILKRTNMEAYFHLAVWGGENKLHLSLFIKLVR